MTETDEKSPKNVHRYSFSVPMRNAVKNNDWTAYKFNLYQFYQLNTKFDEVILEFLRYFIHEENEAGIKFFENEFEKQFKDKPYGMFKLAKFYVFNEDYQKAENEIKKIFKQYDEIKKQLEASGKKVTFLDPPIDDLYFELGKINFYQKNYDKALENFKTANVINPLHATALYNAAITLKKLGLNKEATQLYKDAIEINPFLRETANNLIANRNE